MPYRIYEWLSPTLTYALNPEEQTTAPCRSDFEPTVIGAEISFWQFATYLPDLDYRK